MRRATPLGPPLYLALGITKRCNSNCLYCDHWRAKSTAELGIHEWTAIINEVADWVAPAHVYIAGGEPFLRPDLGAIVLAAHKAGLLPSIVTNGTLLPPHRIKEVASWPLVSLTISIDSLSPEPHDRIHGLPGMHHKAMTALKGLLQRGMGPRLRVAAVITGFNLHDLIPLAQWVFDQGIGGFTVQPLGEPFERTHDPSWYEKSPLRLAAPQDVKPLAESLKQLKTLGCPVMNPARQLDALPAYYENPERGLFLPCRAGSTSLGIGPRGDLRFCPSQASFGQWGAGPLRDQWAGAAAASARTKILKCVRGCSMMNCTFNPTLRERVTRWKRALAH
jgi:MoaA/NifB/PqqE/SkfB family radical SAM enzyme